MTANSLYSNFIDFADINGNLKNNKDNLDYISALAGGIIRYDLYNELSAGAVYPIIGSTEFSHSINFINPINSDAAYRLLYPVTGIIHDDLGMKFNGTTQYVDTNFIPSLNFHTTSSHLSIYSTINDSLNDGRDIGVNSINFSYQLCTIRGFNNQGFTYIGDNNIEVKSVITNYDSRGFYIGNRISTNDLSFSRDGIRLSQNVNLFIPIGTPSSVNKVFIGCTNANGTPTTFSNRRYGYVSMGLGLTQNKLEKYSHLIKILQGIKNRQ